MRKDLDNVNHGSYICFIVIYFLLVIKQTHAHEKEAQKEEKNLSAILLLMTNIIDLLIYLFLVFLLFVYTHILKNKCVHSTYTVYTLLLHIYHFIMIIFQYY